MEKTLDDIGIATGTDRSSAGLHDYLRYYDKLLTRWRHEPIRILEIGVLDGRGLRMWDEYFTHPDARIVGLELRTDYWEPPADSRMKVVRGSQDELNTLLSLDRMHGPFDVIIDDGSHISTHQRGTMMVMLPRVKSGGLYIVEDLCATFQQRYQGADQVNLIDWLCNRVKEMHAHGKSEHAKYVAGQSWEEDCMSSISFRKGLCVIRRR